jgi:hypothetical protein
MPTFSLCKCVGWPCVHNTMLVRTSVWLNSNMWGLKYQVGTYMPSSPDSSVFISGIVSLRSYYIFPLNILHSSHVLFGYLCMTITQFTRYQAYSHQMCKITGMVVEALLHQDVHFRLILQIEGNLYIGVNIKYGFAYKMLNCSTMRFILVWLESALVHFLYFK